jgi:two-component system, NarL family, response regulator LiaR
MTEAQDVRVMIVDDHDMVRIGLKITIEKNEGFSVVAEASNGAEAVDLYKKYKPDVVLMDLMMPVLDGVKATTKIMEFDAEARIIALTSFVDDPLIHSAIEAGVISYLLKDISMKQLAQAIRDAYHGKATLAQEATQALMRAARGSELPGHDLTQAELRVLKLIRDGASNSEIAQKLFISKSTVKKHVSRILSKMNVSNRAEAAVLSFKQKLIDDDQADV